MNNAELIARLGVIAGKGMADYFNSGHPNSNAITEAAAAIEALEAKVIEQDAVIEQRNAELSRGYADFTQAVTDPENQPSQWGTVTLAMYQALETQLATERRHNERATNHLQDQRDALQAEVERLSESCAQLRAASVADLQIHQELRKERDALQAQLAAAQGQERQPTYEQVCAWAEQCRDVNVLVHGPWLNPEKLCKLAAEWAAAPIPQQPAPSAPEGWKLVPIEPTEAMLEVGFFAENDVFDSAKTKRIHVWKDMIAAAPQPKEKQ